MKHYGSQILRQTFEISFSFTHHEENRNLSEYTFSPLHAMYIHHKIPCFFCTTFFSTQTFSVAKFSDTDALPIHFLLSHVLLWIAATRQSIRMAHTTRGTQRSTQNATHCYMKNGNSRTILIKFRWNNCDRFETYCVDVEIAVRRRRTQ